uniref:Uncharacterized protein n=1 Tax=Fagus sylvatica TaxID=28930 RepID=A0A2N9F6X3_FAGSY
MDPMNPANPGGREVGLGWTEDNATEVEYFRHQVDEICTKLEKQVNEVEQFYSASGNSSIVKDKDREKHFTSVKKQQQDASYREAAASKRMLELMRQFATILRQASTKSLHLSLMYKSGLSLRYSCKFHG